MFGLGFFELCIIAIFSLIFVGPKKLPELMNQFGRFFVQVRRMSNDVKSSVDEVIQDAERELQEEELAHHKLAIEECEVNTPDNIQTSNPQQMQAAQTSQALEINK